MAIELEPDIVETTDLSRSVVLLDFKNSGSETISLSSYPQICRPPQRWKGRIMGDLQRNSAEGISESQLSPKLRTLLAFRCAVAGFRELGWRLVGFAGARQAIDLPGSDGPQQFVRLKLLGQRDQPALLPGSNVQATAGDDFQQVDFRDR
jgi:hypothetical protein